MIIQESISSNLPNQQQQQQSPSITRIPEQLVMQNLTHYFIAPSNKPLPYLYFFTKCPQWQINALIYLYNFVRASHHVKAVHQIFVKILPAVIRNQVYDKEKISSSVGKLVQQIAQKGKNYGPVSVKVLLTRYISLPSAMGQYFATNKLSATETQQIIIEQVCKSLPKLDMQQKIFILNKITTLGHSAILIRSARWQQITQSYPQITKKQSILSAYLQQILNNNTNSHNLETIISQYHTKKQNHGPILRLLHNSQLLPHHAQTVYSLIRKYSDLIVSVFQDLLVWWVQGNDHYLIYNTVKFRANLTASIMMGFPKDTIISYSAHISLGIQRRLMVMVDNKREVVDLIWGILAKHMDFKTQTKVQMLTTTTDQTIRQTQDKIEKQEQILPNKKEINQSNYNQEKEQQQKQKTEENENIGFEPEIIEFVPKAPRNLYDCILGLRNPARKSITLSLLPKIIRQNPDDLVFVWKDLLLQLIYNLQDTREAMVSLFVTRSQQFIDYIADIFFKKQHSLNDKILLMNILSKGVEELSQQPKVVEKDAGHQEFYFKKVSSKYYVQQESDKKADNGEEQKRQSRTRRWGHTRIAHENKLLMGKQTTGVGLKIVDSEPYINRLYEVANKLYFKIISKLTLLSIFPSEPMFTRPMLQLLATLTQNLKNHIEKYGILRQIVEICYQVVQYMDEKSKKVDIKLRKQHTKKWKDTNLAILHLLNKISLAIDKYLPDRMLEYLQKCIIKLKSSHQYGINPIISMIEANIYTNVSGQKTNY